MEFTLGAGDSDLVIFSLLKPWVSTHGGDHPYEWGEKIKEHTEGTKRGRTTNRLENDQENENRDITEAKKKVSLG